MRRLIIRPGAIGDCILAFPALQHLLSDYTEIWVPASVVPIIRFADAVASISSTGLDLLGVGDIKAPEHLVRKLKSFDSIVSWYGSNRIEFRQALERLGIPCQFLPVLPPPGYRGHATDFFAAQVGAPCGLVPRIPFEAATRRDTIVIHPFSGSAKKNWPLELFRGLAERLPCAVEWNAGREDHFPEAQRFDDLAKLANWIAGGRLYIGNDSGITHVAAAVGVPTLALFGPTDPEIWAPRDQNVLVLRRNPMEALRVDEVLAAANPLLGWRLF